MKKPAFVLCFLLTAFMAAAQEIPSAISQPAAEPASGPGMTPVPPPPASISLEQILTPAPEGKVGGSAWCAERNSSYCTYAWNKLTWCCYATYTAPGASCPMICI